MGVGASAPRSETVVSAEYTSRVTGRPTRRPLKALEPPGPVRRQATPYRWVGGRPSRAVRFDRTHRRAGIGTRRAATASPPQTPRTDDDVSDVDGGKAFVKCDPLHQLGDVQGELNDTVLQPFVAANQGNSRNYSRATATDLGVART